jgi:hypothetical protein
MRWSCPDFAIVEASAPQVRGRPTVFKTEFVERLRGSAAARRAPRSLFDSVTRSTA